MSRDDLFCRTVSSRSENEDTTVDTETETDKSLGRKSKTWLFVREPLQRNHFFRFKVKRLVKALRSHNSFHNSCLQQQIVQGATKQSLSMQDSQASSLHLRTFTCHLPIFQAGSPTFSLHVVDNFYSRHACPGNLMFFYFFYFFLQTCEDQATNLQ